MNPAPDNSQGSDLHPRIAAGLLAAILVLAAWLRLSGLTAQSLWWDEVVTWQQARLPLPEMLTATAADNYPPLYNLLARLAMDVFGETELALRLPSALLGIFDILAIYWVGRQVGGRLTGLLAALLLTLSPFHLWYSGEARMYALLACSATLFASTMLSLMRAPRWPMLMASVLAATALLYSHPYGAITWLAICLGTGIVVLAARQLRHLALLIAAQALALLAFAPWAAVLVGRAASLQDSGFWITQVTPWSLFQMAIQLIGGPFLFAALAVALRLSFTKPAAQPIGDIRNATVPHRDVLIVLLAWALLPMLAGVLLSLLLQPMLISRYLIGSLPALCVLIAMGFSRLPRATGGYLGLAALAAAILIGLFAYSLRPRDDFRGLATTLAAEVRPGDCLLMIPEAAIALHYYDRRPVACLATFRSLDDVELGTVAGRIFVLEVLDTHLEGIDTLGAEISRRSFGPSRLIVLQPK